VAGKELRIHRQASGTGAAGDAALHVVRKGETLSSIATQHGTTVASLRRWNQLGRWIYPGQEIKVASN
jgi:membrane-bound lytic murein transglycosylase D